MVGRCHGDWPAGSAIGRRSEQHLDPQSPALESGTGLTPSGSTGCTVILADGGAVAGVDIRGGAPGTRETDLLRPEMSVDSVHAIVLSGGSAYGLAAG